jgi:hypothetical protein
MDKHPGPFGHVIKHPPYPIRNSGRRNPKALDWQNPSNIDWEKLNMFMTEVLSI